MSRIEGAFAAARRGGRAALIPFLMAGDPDYAASEALAAACEAEGADLLELGMPFSDPIADGPTIQRAAQRALAAGATMKGTLDLAARIRARSALPLVLMGYYNPVLSYGARAFVAAAAGAGVDGLLISDLPPEEAGEVREAADAHGLDTVFLVAPGTPEGRISLICSSSKGYIYYAVVRGITGPRAALPGDLPDAIAAIRLRARKPVAVGFGISTPEQAAAAGRIADGVIIGSAIVARVEEGAAHADPVGRVAEFLRAVRSAMTLAGC